MSETSQNEYKLWLNLWCTRHTTSIATAVLSVWGFPGGSDGKQSACSTGDPGLIPGSDRFPEGNDNPLQYSCLENSMDRGVWQATVHGVTNRTQPSDLHLKTFNVFFALQTMQIVISNWPEDYTNCKWYWICSDLDKTSQIQPWGLFPQD